VCGAPGIDAVNDIESLVDKSLVRVDVSADGQPRFHLLVTVRDDASERLDRSGERDEVRQAHAAYFVALGEGCRSSLENEGHARAAGTLDLAWDDLVSATAWLLKRGRVNDVVRVYSAIWIYIWFRGHVDTLAGLKIEADDVDSQHQGQLFWITGCAAFEQGDHERAMAQFERSIRALERVDDQKLLAWARMLRTLTLPAFELDLSTMAEQLTTALEKFVDLGSEFGQAIALINLGAIETMSGDLAQAIDHHQQALGIVTRLNIEAMKGLAHTQLSLSHLTGGNLVEARHALNGAVAIYRSHTYWEGMAFCLETGAALAFSEEDPRRAMIALGAAEAVRIRLGLRPWPSTLSFLKLLTAAADAADHPELATARAAGRLMEPLAAAAVVLQSRTEDQLAV
jgi:tetratricopeptide (TPR) repeat protein